VTVRLPAHRQSPQHAIDHYARATYRQAVLDAAERLFARAGYHDTKMADLAAEAGVAVGTLYKHFKSKEEVFAQLTARNREQLVELLQETRQVADPVARLQTIVRRLFSYVEERGALFAVYVELGAALEERLRSLAGEGGDERACDRVLGVLESVFDDAIRAGRVREDVSLSLLASSFAGAMNSALFAWMRADRKYSLTEQTLPLVDLFLQGASKR
jgi:TetR/AcrR family fatty acid metabolism transcriptional regulator